MTGFEGCRVLVTGGAGFVGSNLVRRLLQLGAGRIHIVDNLLSAERVNVQNDSAILFTEASITDDEVLNSLADEYDFVFHLATYHGNQSSIHDPLTDHANNTLTTLKLYERIKKFRRIRKVVYSSAGCSVAEKTFGDASASVETEFVSLVQDSPYSMSKIFGEFYCNYYHKQHGLPAVRARFQNVYGPGEILGAGKWRGTPATVWRNVTPTFIYKALKREPLPVENPSATRDFIHVEDVVAGLIACALEGKAGDAYNIASGTQHSIGELAEKINSLTANHSGVVKIPSRTWDKSGKRFGSTEKSRRELGFQCSVGIDEGLTRTIQWTRENFALIERNIRKHAAFL